MELGYWAGRWWIREVERVKQSSFVGELAGFLRGKKRLKCIGLLGSVVKVPLSALTATAACCQFPNIKFLSTHRHLPPEDKNRESGNSYNISSLLSLLLFLH